MKLLYVDIDGPLATDECSKTVYHTKWHPRLYKMNPNCVVALNEIIVETECDMIVSSDWRKSFSIEELGEIFEWNGIVKKPIGVTSLDCVSMSNSALNRIHQIKQSLSDLKPTTWAVIDDLPMGIQNYTMGIPNVVFCDPIEGLAAKNKKEEVVNILNHKE
jgi:hypothetical protein